MSDKGAITVMIPDDLAMGAFMSIGLLLVALLIINGAVAMAMHLLLEGGLR